jgi:hypothetical protein
MELFTYYLSDVVNDEEQSTVMKKECASLLKQFKQKSLVDRE